MNRNRRRLLCALFLIFPMLFTSLAQAEVLKQEAKEPLYEDYLVSIREEYWQDYLHLPKVLAVVDAKQISKRHRLMQFSNMEVVRNWFPAEAIAYYEPNYHMMLLEDPSNPPEPTPWNITMIDMDQTQVNFKGQGVRIAIIDTGIKTEHPDLNWDNIETGYNYADGNENTDDINGHGTFVAGVLAAIPQNGNGVDGVVPEATIIPLKVIDSDGTIKISWLIQALEAAVNQFDCDVINVSLGTSTDSAALRAAVNAIPEGVIIVAAAGNDGTALYQYPAAYEKVISVGFVDQKEVIADQSQRNDQLTLVAPGLNVLGLNNTTLFYPNTTERSGSSFAAPHVTAAAALAKQAKANLTAQEFRKALIQTSKDLGEVGYDISYGYGLLQIDALLDKILAFKITPTVVLEKEGSKTWQLDFDQMPLDESIDVLIAGFQISGRMESLFVRTLTPDQYRSSQWVFEMPVTEETEKIKIFLLSSLSSCSPRWPAEILYQKP